jgi:3-hydroxyisobutyrate dehydrogenase-like beta-hydroxyacid dehydrogenase
MTVIGFIGVGKIGLPMCANLIGAGHSVIGYRRSSLAEFEKIGGVPAKSVGEVGAAADIVFTCLPNDEALEDVMAGPHGLIEAARPGAIMVEFGSHPLAVKQRYVAPLAVKGGCFLDGEVSGTPGMVAQKKGAIFLGGEPHAAKAIEPILRECAEICVYFGAFGSATKAKLINNLLVGLHIAGTAQAMAIGLRAGVDVNLLIKALSTGSGASTQFAIRAPWMAQRRFLPQAGSAPGLAHYLHGAKELAGEVDVATPLLDRLIEVFDRALPLIGERDVAAIIEVFENRMFMDETAIAPQGLSGGVDDRRQEDLARNLRDT